MNQTNISAFSESCLYAIVVLQPGTVLCLFDCCNDRAFVSALASEHIINTERGILTYKVALILPYRPKLYIVRDTIPLDCSLASSLGHHCLTQSPSSTSLIAIRLNAFLTVHFLFLIFRIVLRCLLLETVQSGMLSFHLYFGCKRNPIQQKFGYSWILSAR